MVTPIGRGFSQVFPSCLAGPGSLIAVSRLLSGSSEDCPLGSSAQLPEWDSIAAGVRGRVLFPEPLRQCRPRFRGQGCQEIIKRQSLEALLGGEFLEEFLDRFLGKLLEHV